VEDDQAHRDTRLPPESSIVATTPPCAWLSSSSLAWLPLDDALAICMLLLEREPER
jgi:hypothetical protein